MSYTTNIQWKGTDLCMDFNCPKCGEYSHFDGMFAYAIFCSSCRTYFKMPTDVRVVEIPKTEVSSCLYDIDYQPDAPDPPVAEPVAYTIPGFNNFVIKT